MGEKLGLKEQILKKRIIKEKKKAYDRTHKIKLDIIKRIAFSKKSFKELAKFYGVHERTIRRNLKSLYLTKTKTSRKGKYLYLKRFGNESPNWKDGGKKYYCLFCQLEISDYRAIICQKCQNKIRDKKGRYIKLKQKRVLEKTKPKEASR